MPFQAFTTHWCKAGWWKGKRNYRVGADCVPWMDYLQTFPSWWLPGIRGKKRSVMIADAVPPFYVYYMLRGLGAPRGARVLDLYAGIGGWGLGYALYTDRDFYYEAVEFDRERCKALELSLKLLRNYHYVDVDYRVVCVDARVYEPSTSFDIVFGSPPCEDVSALRRLYGHLPPKGTYVLTERYIEIVDAVKPRLAMYENVPDGGLEEMLGRAGFMVELHDMSNILPQTRRRLIAYRMGLYNWLNGGGLK